MDKKELLEIVNLDLHLVVEICFRLENLLREGGERNYFPKGYAEIIKKFRGKLLEISDNISNKLEECDEECYEIVGEDD